MSKLIKVWKGTGFNREVRLLQYQYSDGTTNHYTFYPRVGNPGNPTEKEIQMIIRMWRLEEVEVC